MQGSWSRSLEESCSWWCRETGDRSWSGFLPWQTATLSSMVRDPPLSVSVAAAPFLFKEKNLFMWTDSERSQCFVEVIHWECFNLLYCLLIWKCMFSVVLSCPYLVLLNCLFSFCLILATTKSFPLGIIKFCFNFTHLPPDLSLV